MQSLRTVRQAVRLFSLSAALLLLFGFVPEVHAAETVAPIPLVEGWRHRWGDSPMDSDGIPVWAKEAEASSAWRPAQTSLLSKKER